MTKASSHKFHNSLHLLSHLKLFQIEKTIKEILGAKVDVEVIHPEWENGSVVMYYDFEASSLRAGIIRRIDPAVVTVQDCANGRFETVPMIAVEKIPRGRISESNLRVRTEPPSTFYSIGEPCATATGEGALEIGILEKKTESEAVLFCNGQHFIVPQGEFWRAIGVEL